MTTRGWQNEQVVHVVDTNGMPIDVVVGLVRDQQRRWRRALGMYDPRREIGVGPSALLTVPKTSELIRAVQQSTEDLFGLEGDR